MLGVIYWGANIFEKTTVKIIAKNEIITYNDEKFTADNDSNVNFEMIIKSDKITKNIVLTDSKEISTKATGSITLYNEYSTNQQKIVSGTFLSDNDGKIYTTDTAVIVPGYKTENQKIIPGQANVKISSFLTGEVYNGSPKNFYINAFKSTTKYNKIYGKLKTELTGGAEGYFYTLNDLDLKNLK
jgi:hypothetical protein